MEQLHLKRLQALAIGARDYLGKRSMVGDKPQLIVFDIDGTVLDDTRVILTHPIYYQVFEPMLDLYNYLRSVGYIIVFLTARQEMHRCLTEANLEHVGYLGYSKLIMMPTRDLAYTISEINEWKDQQRRNLKEADGFYLVGCIGDQDADVLGDHIGEYQLRVPVPPKVGLAGLFSMAYIDLDDLF